MSQYKFKINGKAYEVSVNGIENGIADVKVNGASYQVEVEQTPEVAAATGAPAPAGTPGGTGTGASDTAAERGGTASVPTPPAAASGKGEKITSPLPGVVIDVCVKEGEQVKRGQKIAVLEAMKMENEILSESEGKVTAIYVKKGDSILEGADIASIA